MSTGRLCDADAIAAIRANHLKANIADVEAAGSTCDCGRAWVDPGGTIFGDGPYVKVPIVGGPWDGTVQRAYAPARLRRRLAALWTYTPKVKA